MIIDYLDSTSPTDFAVDLCIVGSGAAGLSIARSFIGTDQRVCVLESGGFGGEYKSQSLYDGKSVGDVEVDPATSRMRAFGGSCNLWGGGCIPLTPQDFKSRHWVPESGWPLSYRDMQPYYERARTFCAIEAHEFTDGSTNLPSPVKPIEFDGSDLHNRLCAQSPLLFGPAYREEIASAPNITVLLHANLLEFIPSPGGTTVREARIATLDGRRGVVRARQYVLACGGIENARLLLLSNSVAASGIGNDHDLVGRYFMDHPSVKLGDLRIASPDELVRPYARVTGSEPSQAFPEICLTDEAQEQLQVLNCRVRPIAVEASVPRGIRALRKLRTADAPDLDENELVGRRISSSLCLHGAQLPDPMESANNVARLVMELAMGAWGIVVATARKMAGMPAVQTDHVEILGFFEQAPNRDSRIMLSDDKDAFGQSKVEVNLQLTDLDRYTYQSAGRVFGEELARRFGGRYIPAPWLSGDGTGDPPKIRGTAHHIGTTRMSVSPATGVVDVDCRVHGVDNLYVVGSSVFPTGGWAFPTLTIVALSLRLAERPARPASSS